MRTLSSQNCQGRSAPSADVTKSASELTVGFIFLHDENSTYDLNFINAAEAACKATGAKIIKKTNVPENSACYEAAADLVDSGCDIVFADSFGHEDFIIQAAKEFPNVQFCHATGTKAHTENLANYHNAFASIYQGRYLAGIAAGMKLNEMIAAGQFKAEKAKIGYVGAPKPLRNERSWSEAEMMDLARRESLRELAAKVFVGLFELYLEDLPADKLGIAERKGRLLFALESLTPPEKTQYHDELDSIKDRLAREIRQETLLGTTLLFSVK